MRQAGYCSECQGYVWIGQDGNCSNGHGRPSLRDVHKTDALPSPIGIAPIASATGSVAAPGAATGAAPDAEAPGSPQASVPAQPYPPAGQYPPGQLLPPQAYGPHPDAQQTQLGPNGLPAGVGRFNWGAFLLPVFWPLAYNVPMYAGIAMAGHVVANFLPLAVPGLEIPLITASLALDIWVGFAAHKAYWKKYPNKMTVEQYKKKQLKWVIIGLGLGVLLFGFGVLAGSLMMANGPTPL